jgi:hypothetical protein
MLRRWRAEIIAFVLAVAIGLVIGRVFGVGGWGISDEDRVRDVATAYLHAFADGDAQAVCARVSPLSQQLTGAESCEAGARASMRQLPATERAALRAAEVTSVEVRGGTRATVRFVPKLNGRDDMELVKVDGRWTIGV